MNPLITLEQTPCNIEYLPHDMCNITFTVHQRDIEIFKMLLASLNTLFANLAWKAKTNIHQIHKRLDQTRLVDQEIIQQYHDDVCNMFNQYNEETTPREAFSMTVSSIKTKWENSSYDQVKHILIKAKLLKNTGFYKKR